MDIVRVGVDIAKQNFQICALNQANKVVFNKQVKRNMLLERLTPSRKCVGLGDSLGDAVDARRGLAWHKVSGFDRNQSLFDLKTSAWTSSAWILISRNRTFRFAH